MTLLDDGGRVQNFQSSRTTAAEAEQLWLIPEGLKIFEPLADISEPMRVPDLKEHVRALGLTGLSNPMPVGGLPLHRGAQVSPGPPRGLLLSGD